MERRQTRGGITGTDPTAGLPDRRCWRDRATPAVTDTAELVDRQLLAAWLNFANGSVGWDELIDTDGDSVGDTAFSAVIAGAESARNNPASTNDELEMWKDLLEAINLALA